MPGTEPSHPASRDFPELVGVREVAAILRVRHQRVFQLVEKHPDFPRAVAKLRCGTIWLAEEIREYDKGWVRRIGRPPKKRVVPPGKE